MEIKKKNITSFKEYLEARKKVGFGKNEKKIDCDDRKLKWLESVDELYLAVDDIIVENLKSAGYSVSISKEVVKNTEEYIGSYDITNYFIKTDNFEIKFFPIGTIIIGALGKVNMVLSGETIKIVLTEWGKWKIVSGSAANNKLIEFNEQNIVRLFQENL